MRGVSVMIWFLGSNVALEVVVLHIVSCQDG